MQMQHAFGTGPFMQVIHVLGDDMYLVVLFKVNKSAVSFVGFSL